MAERGRASQSNLPIALTSFVGRERECAHVVRLFDAPDVRLLTMVGPGGVGKTRLALRLGELLMPGYRDGVVWVELAAVTAPALVTTGVAAAVGAHADLGQDGGAGIVEAIGQRRMLLVLDNCEHLLDACAALVEALLRGCPGSRVLATSRERLGVDGEHVYTVGPLGLAEPRALPPFEQLAATEAVRLFVERARAQVPDFALTSENALLVAEICRRLEGLPLAIELAAPWVRALTIGQIAARLADRLALPMRGARTSPPRQRTLAATVGWSFDLLDDLERSLLMRLSVFVGSWTVEAAEAVCGDADLSLEQILPVLGRLIDKSLVLADPAAAEGAGYRLLEGIRLFAWDRLASEALLGTFRRRHAEYFARRAEDLGRELHSLKAEAAHVRLTADFDNVMSALGWAIENTETALGYRLAGGLWWLWMEGGGGGAGEGRARLGALLALPDASNAPGRAAALARTAGLAWLQGDDPEALTLAEEALELARADGHSWAAALALQTRAAITLRQAGDAAAASAWLEESLSLWRQSDDPWGLGFSLFWLGNLAAMRGEAAAARRHFEEAIRVARASGNRWCAAGSLGGLAAIAAQSGEVNTASALLRESLAVWPEVSAGLSAASHGELAAAEQFLRQALAVLRAIDDRGQIVAVIESCAAVAAARGQARRALRLAAASSKLGEQIGLGRGPYTGPHATVLFERARAALGRTADAARSEGAAMSLEEASTAALADRADETDAPSGRGSINSPLSSREQEVANLVARGLTNRQMAEQLVLSERTVDRHMSNILAKLGFATRSQLAAWVVESRLRQRA